MYISHSSVYRCDRKGIFKRKPRTMWGWFHTFCWQWVTAPHKEAAFTFWHQKGGPRAHCSVPSRGVARAAEKTNSRKHTLGKLIYHTEKSKHVKTVGHAESERSSLLKNVASSMSDELGLIQVAPAKVKWGSSRSINHLKYLQKQFSRYFDIFLTRCCKWQH